MTPFVRSIRGIFGGELTGASSLIRFRALLSCSAFGELSTGLPLGSGLTSSSVFSSNGNVDGWVNGRHVEF